MRKPQPKSRKRAKTHERVKQNQEELKPNKVQQQLKKAQPDQLADGNQIPMKRRINNERGRKVEKGI